MTVNRIAKTLTTRRLLQLFLATAAAAFPLRIHAQRPSAPSGSSVRDGVYTSSQAERGSAVYVRHCARCHGDDLANPRNPLSGERFVEHWESRTLADLFRRIRDTMPAGEVATVDDSEKLDTMAYVLQQNGFPEGDAALTADADALGGIQFTGNSGPQPLRTGALVRTAGCLDLRGERDWQLTNATEPRRATLDTPSGGAARPAPSPERGAQTIELLNPFPNPLAHRGHRIAVTGFLVRRAHGDAVNVVSLEMLAPGCAP